MSIVLDGTAGITTPEITSAGGPLVVNASAPDNSVVVDASGNVGVGTSSPNSYGGQTALTINGSSYSRVDFNTGGTKRTSIYSEGSSNLIFETASSERARIDSSGNLLVGKTVTTATVNGIALTGAGTLYATSTGDTAEFYRKTTFTDSGVFLTKSDVGGTASLKGVAYANGTFAAVSDARMKKNVEDARSYLNDVMQVRVVKYNWITDEDETPKELGWIAQEVEQVFPGMVNEMGGSKLLKKEVFLPMLMKCIQELKAINDAQTQTINAQQAALESLTARVVALDARLISLEGQAT